MLGISTVFSSFAGGCRSARSVLQAFIRLRPHAIFYLAQLNAVPFRGHHWGMPFISLSKRYFRPGIQKCAGTITFRVSMLDRTHRGHAAHSFTILRLSSLEVTVSYLMVPRMISSPRL